MTAEPPFLKPDGFPGQRLVIVPPAIAVKAARQPITRDLIVTHIGAFAAAGGHYVERPRGTSQHILIACISGKGHATLNGNDWQIGPGDLLFLPPRQAHHYRADSVSPWTILWAHFRGERACDYLRMLGISAAQPLTAVHETDRLHAAFEDAFHHVTLGFGEAALIGLSTGFTRLLGLVRVMQCPPGGQSPKTKNRLFQTLHQLHSAPEKPWTVEQMAQEACLSVPHFTNLCRRQTGMPPLAYLIRLRLQRAMDLLQQGQCNVVEAARAVGYDDPFYFSRLFRKHFGIPPSACRQGP